MARPNLRTDAVLVAFAGLILALAAPAFAGEPGEWRPVDAETGQISNIDDLEALARDFPDSASVRVRLLNAQITEEETENALATLEWLKARGHVFSEAAQVQLAGLLGEEHMDAVRALLIAAPEVIKASEVIATLPAAAGLIESVLAPEGHALLVATSVTGKAIHIRDGDSWIAIPVPGASDLSGIVSEPDDSMGWVASANLDGSMDEEPLFTGLMGLRADFQNPVLVPAPDGVVLSDLAIGPDATVYASDPIGGGVYSKRLGATEMEVLLAPGILRSPQGLALSGDGARLYVSDYRYGIAIIDLATRAVSRLVSDVPVILDGVDGLWLHENELIAVQNGASPMRITAFALSDDGLRVTGVRVLEQAHPRWTEPLGGSVSHGSLTYVATGQWDRYDKGEPIDGKPPIATEIRRLRLSKATN